MGFIGISVETTLLKRVLKILNCLILDNPGGRRIETYIKKLKLLILETPGGRQEESYPRPHLLNRKYLVPYKLCAFRH